MQPFDPVEAQILLTSPDLVRNEQASTMRGEHVPVSFDSPGNSLIDFGE